MGMRFYCHSPNQVTVCTFGPVLDKDGTHFSKQVLQSPCSALKAKSRTRYWKETLVTLWKTKCPVSLNLHRCNSCFVHIISAKKCIIMHLFWESVNHDLRYKI